MKNKQKSFIAGVLATGMFFSSALFVSAETAASSASVEALTAQIQGLLAQIQLLQSQLTATKKEVVAVRQELALSRTLAFGSKGKDVSDLQEFLKNYPELYPEGLVTGYYGRATEKAIKKLQEKHGLENVGVVGPKTRVKLKLLFSEHGGKGLKCDDGRCTAVVANATGTAATTTTGTNGVSKVTLCHKSKETITVGSPALSAHLAHGDTLGTCGGGGTSTTTPDTTAPVISNIVSSPLPTSAGIAWDTNENATYEFWYGTTTPSTLGTPNMTGGLNTHQAVGISGLTPDTTYYFVIAAKDAAGNISTSTMQSFKTTVDVTAPAISGLTTSGITATGATILWNTDESADGTVWYSTVNPVDTASTTVTSSVTNATLSLSHSFPLTGLTASTTYYYLVSSKDAIGNRATSSQASFLTL